MSPVFILSRLCLKRRFQFGGIGVAALGSGLTTFFTGSSALALRGPTFSAFSAGTSNVKSLCRILIVRYSRVSPRTSRFSRFTTVPAPWCGYTTLSPTLYKLTPSPVGFRRRAGAFWGRRRGSPTLPNPCSGSSLAEPGGERPAERVGDERHP